MQIVFIVTSVLQTRRMDILVICAISVLITIAECFRPPVTGRCVYTREFKMNGAECSWLNLETIPALNTNIEILVASSNRIRELTNDSLKNYSSLRYLYLANNFITRIEPEVFSPLTELEVLDLSTNGIRQLPSDLPSPLRRLYLSENPLENFSLSSAYNLQFLTLANCQLKQLPSIGVLPSLEDLNLTGNPLTDLTPKDLAPFCRLRTLHLPETLYQQPDYECECHKLLTWTTQRYINLGNYTCVKLADPDEAGCDTNTTTELREWKDCLTHQPHTAATRNFLFLAFISSLIIAVVVLGCWWHRRKRKTPARVQKKPVSTLIT